MILSFSKEVRKLLTLKDWMGDTNSVELKLFRNGVLFSNISSIQIDCFHMWEMYKTVHSIVNASNFLRRVSKAMNVQN